MKGQCRGREHEGEHRDERTSDDELAEPAISPCKFLSPRMRDRSNILEKIQRFYLHFYLSVVYNGSSLCAFLVSKPMGSGLTTAFPDSSMASLFSGLPPAVVRRPEDFLSMLRRGAAFLRYSDPG